MALILTTEEKLEVLRRRIATLRGVYAENVLTLELLALSGEAPDEVENINKQQEHIENNIFYMMAQIDALEEVRLDTATDLISSKASTNGKSKK